MTQLQHGAADPLHSPAEEALQTSSQQGVPSGLVLPETARAVRNGIWEVSLHPFVLVDWLVCEPQQ